MTKKVLIYSKNLQAGGAERQLVYIASILSRECNVYFMVNEKEGVFVEDLERKGIPIINFRNKSVWRSSRELRYYIKHNNIDTVISYLPECNLISELSAFPFKSWRIIVGARSANPDFVTNRRLRVFYYAHLLANLVISNSEANKRDVLKVNRLLRKDKVRVIYNILNPSTHCSSAYQPFMNNRVNLVVAANYRKVKNLDGVLKGLVLLNEEQRKSIHIDWYGLEVDGSMSEGDCFIRENSLDEVITLHPSIDNVLEVYNKADVVGLFSHYEGLPNSLCEALVHGKMIISTPVSDMPFLLSNTNNIVCEDDSSEAISLGLLKLIMADRALIISTGRKNKIRYSSLFSSKSIEQQLLQLI